MVPQVAWDVPWDQSTIVPYKDKITITGTNRVLNIYVEHKDKITITETKRVFNIYV